MASQAKKDAMDAEAAAWRRLADHLAECEQKGVPLSRRSCSECSRLHAAHQKTCKALHAYGSRVGVLSDLSRLMQAGAPR